LYQRGKEQKKEPRKESGDVELMPTGAPVSSGGASGGTSDEVTHLPPDDGKHAGGGGDGGEAEEYLEPANRG